MTCDYPGQLISLSADLGRATTTDAVVGCALNLSEMALDSPTVRICEDDPGGDGIRTLDASGPHAGKGWHPPDVSAGSPGKQRQAHEAGSGMAEAKVVSRTDSGGPVQTELLVPVGGKRLLCLGATEQDAFDDTDVHTAESIATAVESAFDRIDHRETADENTGRFRRFHELTVGSDSREFDTTIDQLLLLGRDYLDLETGILSHIEKTDCERERLWWTQQGPTARAQSSTSARHCAR